ncbi:MAG: hypothetical protein HC827_18920 [Cyanobacteria bacterium RM1_2_2]|nr:hypothetical protein [Cyanobacteria bacterium RM1_2_2]
MVLSNRYTEYDTWAWLYNQTMGPQYSASQIRPLENLLLPSVPQKRASVGSLLRHWGN